MNDDTVMFTVKCMMTNNQAVAFHSMLKMMESCGQSGMSRIVGMYADGDGNFHPRFSSTFKCSEVKPLPEPLKKDDMYIYDEDYLVRMKQKMKGEKC